MIETEDPCQPAGDIVPKKKLDLKDLNRWTRTELQISPFGRVLIGPMSINAMKPITQAIEQSPSLPNAEVVRAILKAVVEIPNAEESWDGRKLTEEESAQINDVQLEAFATAGLSRKDWFVKEKEAADESDYAGPAIPELVRRLRNSFERLNKQARDIVGSISPIFSTSTRALIEQTEKLARLSQLQSSFADGFRSPLQDMMNNIEKSIVDISIPGIRAAEALQREMEQISKQNSRLANWISPHLGSAEILRKQVEMASQLGMPGQDVTLCEANPQLGDSQKIPKHNQLKVPLESPKLVPIGDHFKALSRENRELREVVSGLSALMQSIRELIVSALIDNANYQSTQTKATSRNFKIAIASVIVSAIFACGQLAYSIYSGRGSNQQQEQVIQALQQQNLFLEELVKGQKDDRARKAEEQIKVTALRPKRALHHSRNKSPSSPIQTASEPPNSASNVPSVLK